LVFLVFSLAVASASRELETVAGHGKKILDHFQKTIHLQDSSSDCSKEMTDVMTPFYTKCQSMYMGLTGFDMFNTTNMNAALNQLCTDPCYPDFVKALTSINCNITSGNTTIDYGKTLSAAFKFMCTSKYGATDANGNPQYCFSYLTTTFVNTTNYCSGITEMGCCFGSLVQYETELAGVEIAAIVVGAYSKVCNLTVVPPPCPSLTEKVDLLKVTFVMNGVNYSWYTESVDNSVTFGHAFAQNIADVLGIDLSQISITSVTSSAKFRLMSSAITISYIILGGNLNSIKTTLDASISAGFPVQALAATLPASATTGTLSVDKSSSSSVTTAGGFPTPPKTNTTNTNTTSLSSGFCILPAIWMGLLLAFLQ